MKRILLAFVATACAGNTAFAQLHSHNQSVVGLKLGGSASNFVGEQAPYFRYIYGFNAGVYANLPLSRPFSIQPEVLFSMKGSQGSAQVDESIKKLQYVDVPVAFRASSNSFFVEAGPQAGFLIKATDDASGETVSVRKSYRSIDLGYLLGVGYQPKNGGLGIGGRYNGGFLSVLSGNNEGVVVADKRNSVFQLYLTYSAQKHKKNKKNTVR